MTALRRRAVPPLRSLLAIALALALATAACGPSVTGTPKPSTGAGASGGVPSPGLTAVPGGLPTPVVGATIGPPTTTDTEFGTIFDSLPASFPKLAGQEPTETDGGPTSGSFAVNMSAAAASKAIEAALSAQGWAVDVGSPLEDGSVVLEATGAATCKAEVRFTPLSGTVIMSVLYGASCPFS